MKIKIKTVLCFIGLFPLCWLFLTDNPLRAVSAEYSHAIVSYFEGPILSLKKAIERPLPYYQKSRTD